MTGVQGEALATDVVRIGPAQARALVMVSSGMHGVEGYCGSACQLALLEDRELRERLDKRSVALLLIHAINPHGFSYQRRTNEDNVDLNRSFIDFSRPLPENPAYAEIHELLLPERWPPTEANAQAIREFIDRKGATYFRDAFSMGQVALVNGLFYRGREPTWSNRTLRSIVREYGQPCDRIIWVDIHTGLGPRGHGEKIFAAFDESQPAFYDPAELERARRYWGADVFSIVAGQSASRNARGGGITCLAGECPHAEVTTLGLEFGTLPSADVTLALRADHWLHNHPNCSAPLRESIKQQIFSAFCLKDADWQGMVLGQTRVLILQAIMGISEH
jgi:Protein of unknown function (DUF2817)